MSDATAENGTGPAEATESRLRPHWQVWLIALAAGVASGLAAWLVGECVHEVYRPQLFNIQVGPRMFVLPTTASVHKAEFKNATLVFTVLGGVTGLVMGAAGGFAARSTARGLAIGLGGLVVGAAVGAGASLGLLPFSFRRAVPDPNDLLTPILIHGGIWMAIGAVGGAAFAIGMRRGRLLFNAALGACLGAFLATLVFHGLSEAFLPDSASTPLVATSAWVRLLALPLITFLSACGAARGALGRASGAKNPRLSEV
jgi:hypothetical protein